MTWLVDAHAHYHECFGWGPFLSGALRNLERAQGSDEEPGFAAACLLLANREGQRYPGHLRDSASARLPSGWTLEDTGEADSVVLRSGNKPPVILVGGRQIVTRERLEVLALACREPIPDGLSLKEAAHAALTADAVAVLPWGFGKWLGKRGRAVARLLEGEDAHRLFLGDNGNRPGVWATPSLFQRAEERGVYTLPGSDPLPFPHHSGRGASYGFGLSGQLDLQRPGESVRRGVRGLSGSPSPVGALQGLCAFMTDQLRLRLPTGAPGAPTLLLEGGTP